MPLPRRARFRAKGLLGWPTLIFVFAVIFLVVAGWEVTCRQITRHFGKSSTAVVEGKTEWTTQSKHGTTHHYGVYIKYPAPMCKNRKFEKLSYSQYVSVGTGDVLGIYYFDKLPGYPALKSRDESGIFYFLLSLLAGFLVLTVWWILRQKSFIENGMPAEGVVIREYVNRKGQKSWVVTYSWKEKFYQKAISSKGLDTGYGALIIIMPEKPESFAVYDSSFLWELDDWGTPVL